MKRQLMLLVLSGMMTGIASAAPLPVTLLKASNVATNVANDLYPAGCKYDENDPNEEGRRVSDFSQNHKG
ncbi:MAG TPA: hypothetical protein VM432_11375, partial [Bdellovibrionales bacterium]|nr:hypothetical protein [Bdellovibrionales bacterium]